MEERNMNNMRDERKENGEEELKNIEDGNKKIILVNKNNEVGKKKRGRRWKDEVVENVIVKD